MVEKIYSHLLHILSSTSTHHQHQYLTLYQKSTRTFSKLSCSLGKLSLEKSARVHSCKNLISGSRIDSSSSHYTKLTLISDVEDQFATKIVKIYKYSLGSLTQSAMSSSSESPFTPLPVHIH